MTPTPTDDMRRGYALIPLSRGQSAIVDIEDYEWLSQWKWHCNNFGYARRDINNMTQGRKHYMIGLL